jgi:hypothetical protein
MMPETGAAVPPAAFRHCSAAPHGGPGAVRARGEQRARTECGARARWRCGGDGGNCLHCSAHRFMAPNGRSAGATPIVPRSRSVFSELLERVELQSAATAARIRSYFASQGSDDGPKVSRFVPTSSA